MIKANVPVADRLRGLAPDRLARDPRPERRRVAAGPGRHAVLAGRLLAAAAHPGRLHRRAADRGAHRASGRARASPSCARTCSRRSSPRPVEKGDDDGFDPDEDPLLGDAISLVVEMGTASTSMLQRRLRLGYTRAGRLIDMLERRGIISGYEGSKPRQVLVTEARSAARAGRAGARGRAPSPSRSGCRRTTTWPDAARKLALAGRRGGAGSLRRPMPEIGATLREARMRAADRHLGDRGRDEDPRQVPARARERGVGRCCPGPTFVKSFLRTYADDLGLDGARWSRSTSSRHERLSDDELQPIAPPRPRERAGAGRRGPAVRARLDRWRVVVAGRCSPGCGCSATATRATAAARHARRRPSDRATTTTTAGTGVAAKNKAAQEEGQGRADGRAPEHRPDRARSTCA